MLNMQLRHKWLSDEIILKTR